MSGPAAVVVSDSLPFMVTTAGANERFVLPVRASQTFTLRVLGPDGALRGTATGVAPASGRVDIGDPVGASTGRLTLTVEPGAGSIVDLTAPVIFQFSEPLESRSVAPAIVVLDGGGNRVFGSVTIDSAGLSVTFRPTRRWRYGTTYRYAVATTVQAQSGARMSVPFTGEFTTFRPSVVAALDLGDTRDVAVLGSLAVAATTTGLATVDITSPRSPSVHARAALTAGARGVAILPQISIVDRTGTSRTGTFAIAAGGSTTTPGLLQIFDVNSPGAPAAIGSVQLTAASGTTPPPPVPTFAGTPQSVVAFADGRAFVAIESVGVASATLGQSIPPDPLNPGGALGPRYPTGAESASHVAQLGDRLLVAGAAGLTVLNAATLTRQGGVSTEGNPRGVAALPSFAMDVNGDGTIATTERFDLAAVANGADGRLSSTRFRPRETRRCSQSSGSAVRGQRGARRL